MYSFGSNSLDGGGPRAGLIMDAAGNLYGTTSLGGPNGGGTVFEIAAGTHEETILHSFVPLGPSSTDGSGPSGGLIMDAAGNLFGTTNQGGVYGGGTVFEIAAGTHQESIVYSFGGVDMLYKLSGGLIADSQGNLYGTAKVNGIDGSGAVFELSNTGFVVPETSSFVLAAMGLLAFAVPCIKRVRGATK